MGMDVYIEPEFSNRQKEFEAKRSEAVERRNNAKTDEERERAQEEVNKAYKEMYKRFYFRTQYNPYGLHHWLDVNIGEGYKSWGLSIFDDEDTDITDIEKIKPKLHTVNEWIEKTKELETSVLWVSSGCHEDYEKEAIDEKDSHFGMHEKLVRLSAEQTKDYKEWLNDLKEFLEDAVELVGKGSKVVISA